MSRNCSRHHLRAIATYRPLELYSTSSQGAVAASWMSYPSRDPRRSHFRTERKARRWWQHKFHNLRPEVTVPTRYHRGRQTREV